MTAVRHEINNLESSVVVQELEFNKFNKNTQNTPSNQSREQSPAITEEKDILQKILSFMEKSDNNALQNNLPQAQGNSNAQGHMYNQKNEGQGHVASQGQNQGQGRYANLQCFYCSERGHIKVNCLVLKAEREQGFQPQQNRGQMSFFPALHCPKY